jgi:hypothetical protein
MIGDDIFKSLVTLGDPKCTEERFVNCTKQEALCLAIDAWIVPKGLTVMVTEKDDECMTINDSHQVDLSQFLVQLFM